VNLEAIYVDSEEFSFEELLAKKRGIYGITSKQVERPTSPAEPVFKPLVLKSPENIFPSKPSLVETGKRSPLQPKSDVKTPSPKPSVSFQEFRSTDEDEVVSVPIRGNCPLGGRADFVDEDSTPRKPLKKRPSPTINTKAALDDIIDIFSQPLKSQQELDEAEESSSDDESDAASLTSRSFGDKSDVEDLPPPTQDDVEEDDEVSVAHVAEQVATVDLSPENQDVVSAVEPQKVPPPPSQVDATPPQQFVFPEQHERRFNVNLMSPIEERTETSIFQHSQDDSSFLQSPVPSSHQQPRFQRPQQPQTPLRQVPSSNTSLSSSPFEDYIPKPRPTTLKKPLAPKRPTTTTPPQTSPTPTGPIIKEDQCNPQDFALQKQIFDTLRPAIDTYDGYHTTEHETFNKVPSIERFIRALSTKEPGQTQALEMRIHLGQTEYLIRRKLGQGAYAPVFLGECVRTGELRAIKVEKSPPRKWEFYLMRQAKRRLGVSRAAEGMIDALGLHLFRDESYLVLEYRDQGTILALVNAVKVAPIGGETTGVMDEVLAMFFTVELLRTVEGLHAKGILHGDLKPDNCLLRLDEADLPHPYRRDGQHNWSKKGVALIDFGRGIDMTLFPASVRFIADWKTDEQDCPEMREMRPWTHQVDYWGLAGIIHSMLFGKYISVRWEPVGTGKKRWFLREGLKRYWQGEMWKEVLDVLMNPVLVVAEGGLGVPERLRACRERMEGWLEENSERGVGLRAMIRRIENRSG
jgi:checkpoint serine/threonine-protein kinase